MPWELWSTRLESQLKKGNTDFLLLIIRSCNVAICWVLFSTYMIKMFDQMVKQSAVKILLLLINFSILYIIVDLNFMFSYTPNDFEQYHKPNSYRFITTVSRQNTENHRLVALVPSGNFLVGRKSFFYKVVIGNLTRA